MSLKCLHTIFRKPSFILVIAITTLSIIEGIACAEVQNPLSASFDLNVMDEQKNEHLANFDYELYDPDYEGWCDDGHVTDNNDAEFRHMHILDNWPHDGYTVDDSKRYFDEKWKTHEAYAESSGTASPRFNCMSYAFGFTDCWVLDDDEIIEHDYEPADESDADIASWSGEHACTVSCEPYCCEYWIDEISQKDANSAIFTFYYTAWDLKLSPHYTSEASLFKEDN